MRITHCIYNLDSGGGAENLLVDMINIMCITHECQLIIVNNIYDQEMLNRIDKKVKVVKLNRIPGSKSITPLIRLNVELIKFRTEVVHCHNYSIPAYILPMPGCKLFYTIHDLNIPMKYAGRMSCMFAISEAVKDDATKRTKSKIVVIPNGINTRNIIEKNKFEYTTPLTLNIVNVARLEHDKKGQDILINAVALLKKENIIVNVDFIGEGSSFHFLSNLIKSKGLEKQVRLLGFKDREYVYQHLCDYDLMCHPSRYEGFGLTVAEGMAANLPLLVSNDGGPFELIGKGDLGASFKMDDVADCARSIKEMMHNYLKYVSLLPAAKDKVLREYSINSMVEKYLKEYYNH